MKRTVGYTVLAGGTFCILAGIISQAATEGERGEYLSPCAIVASPDGKLLYIAEATAGKVAVFDIAASRLASTIAMPAEPTGLALSADGSRLFVTCAEPEGTACIVETSSKKMAKKVPVGHGACGPAISPDGATLYVCNRFNNNVSVVNVTSGKETTRIAVPREPVSAAVTPDGKRLFVANLLPVGPADVDNVAASVTVIDTTSNKVAANIGLPSGSTGLRGVCVSPDGKFAYVAHILARFHMPTTQLERGWMNTNALSIINVAEMKLFNTVLLDDVDKGAANPWAVVCTADGAFVCVTHAGTHELSVVNAPALIEKLAKMPAKLDPAKPADYTSASVIAADVPNDLSFLVGMKRRMPLKGNGPRGLALVGTRAYAAEYFSDSLSVVDITSEARATATALALGANANMTVVRRGEMLFNDASLCFQTWQSCASCHPDARADGLNWDLLNDGIGNPKNTKSMLLSHKTPPVMSSGIRDTAEIAVRSGIKFIQFAVRPEEDAVAIDEYLKSMKPVPSPYLVKGKLSPAARRGEKVFLSKQAACATCHPAPLFTDLKTVDVGTGREIDRRNDFDAPTLIEIWRTAPYLHDGRSVTLKDMLTKDNPGDKHGKTSHLTEQQIEDLVEYLLSL